MGGPSLVMRMSVGTLNERQVGDTSILSTCYAPRESSKSSLNVHAIQFNTERKDYSYSNNPKACL